MFKKRKTPAEIEALILQAAHEIEAAQHKLTAAQTAHTESILEDGFNSPQSEKLLAEAAAAGRTVDAYQELLVKLRGQLSTARDEENRNALKARWQEAVQLADERLRAARLVGDACAALAAAYGEIVRINEQLYAATPGASTIDMDAAMMRREQIGGAVRIELARLGCEWAVSRMEQPHIVEGVASKFERSTIWLKQKATVA